MRRNVGAVLAVTLLLSPSSFGQIRIDDVLEGFIKADFRPVYLEDSFLPIDPLRSHLSLGEVGLSLSNEHPRLLFSRQRSAELQSRIRRRPYSIWWNSLKNRAQAALLVDLSSPDFGELEKALYAEACAFVYFIEGEGRYLQKAKEALLHISPPPHVVNLEGGEPGGGWGDFVSASETMLPYLVAYDIIAPELTGQEDRFVRHRLAAEAIQLYHYLPVATPNNHKTVMAAAVGAAALCLSPHEDYEITPDRWMERAIEGLEVGLSEISRDGSYKEGPYYATYIAQQTFAFFLFVKNCTGVNYFEDIRIRKFCKYLLDIRNPGGEIVVFNDSHRSRYNCLPLASGNLRESRSVNWAVTNDPFLGQRGYNLVASIANFDDRIPPERPPDVEVNFYPDGGQAIFRNNGKKGATYAVLLGEPGKEFSTGHEHYDPGSILLNLYGQDFFVASGYGPKGTSSANRDYYLLPESENVVLINGRGPNRNPLSTDDAGSKLVDLFHTDKVAAASVVSSYRGAELKRTLFFPDFNYLVLYDYGESLETTDFTLLFHTPTECQFTEARSLTLEAAAGEKLKMVTLGDLENFSMTFGSGIFSVSANLEEVSTLIKVNYLKQKELNSPILLLPEDIDIAELPLVENRRATAFIIQPFAPQAKRHVAVACDSGSCQYEGITTDAKFCLFEKSAAGMEFLYAFGCSEFLYEKGLEFTSSRKVDIFLQNCRRGWSGFISSRVETAEIEIYVGSNPGRVVFADRIVPYDYEAGSVSFEVTGSGYLTLGPVEPVSVPYRYRESPNVTRRLLYHPDPRWYYDHLTPEMQTQANEEIAKEVMSAFNGEIDGWMVKEGFENPQAGRWGTALAGFVGQFAHANVGVAQELSGSWRIKGNQMQIVEEGLIKEERLYLRRLWMNYNIGESSTLNFRRNSLFKGHDSEFLGVDFPGRYGAFIQREAFREKKDYSFGASWREGFNLSFQTNIQRPGPGRVHYLLFQKGRTKNRISFGRTPQGVGFKSFYYSYTDKLLSPWLFWSCKNDITPPEVGFGFVARPSAKTSVEARFSDPGEVSSRFGWRGSSWGGEIHLFRLPWTTTGFLRTDLTRNRWHFELSSDLSSEGRFLRGENISAEWLGDYSLSGGLTLRHLEDDKDWESEIYLNKGVTERISSSGRAAYLFERGEVSLLGAGFYYYGKNQLGWDFAARKFSDQYYYYLSSYLNFYFRKAVGLSILSELQFDEGWDLVSAREVVGQLGGGISPGIYHRYDRFFGHEVQGNLSFRF